MHRVPRKCETPMTGGPWAFRMGGAGAQAWLASMSAAEAHMDAEVQLGRKAERVHAEEAGQGRGSGHEFSVVKVGGTGSGVPGDEMRLCESSATADANRRRLTGF